MKKVILILVFINSSLMCFASTNNKSNLSQEDLVEQRVGNLPQENDIIVLLKECTVKFDVELEDGTTITGEITFSDVSWWDCTKMKFGAWWASTF